MILISRSVGVCVLDNETFFLNNGLIDMENNRCIYFAFAIVLNYYLNVINMEVRIYNSLETRSVCKPLFCSRVSCLDIFSYEKCIDTFRSIYGSDVVIEFLIV